MATINIPQHEHGIIRVFAISRPMSDMTIALEQQPKALLASTLLGHNVADADVELFPLSDLVGVGLPQYLIEGYDVDKNEVHNDRARLEALDGYVLLLFSRVSNDGDVALHPLSDLTLIGMYAEPKADHTSEPITTDAASPYSGVAPPVTAMRRSRVGSVIVVAVTLLTLLLIWWILR